MSFVFSLREIYELRHVKSRLTPRVSIGRLFVHKNQFGIKDHSWKLWPIEFELEENEEKLKTGDVIQFYGEFKDLDPVVKPGNDTITRHNTQISSRDLSTRSEVFQIKTIIEISRQTKNYDSLSSENSDRLNLLKKRNSAFERTKQFFSNRDFFYAETPLLVPSGGMESYLHTFQTEYRDYRGRSWTFELPTSPEFALKKLIAEGIPKIFQISHAFRNNGEHSPLHEPEFMMLEWYRVGGTLSDVMFDTQNLVHVLAKHLNCKTSIPKTWKIFHVNNLFIKKMGLNLEELQDTRIFYEKSKHLSISLRETDTWDDIFCKLFMEKIEPFLKKQVACFVTGYPAQMSALAANEKKNPLFVQRTEAYLFGVEICNGYQELVDSYEFEKRFQKTLQFRAGNVRRDEYFERVMRFGLPPCAGNALGIDRVIALLLGIKNIQKLFPLPFQFSV